MIDPLTAVIIGALVSSGIGGIVLWIKRKKEKDDIHHKTMDDLSKQVWRIEKALLILVKLLDKQIKKSHPELESDLSDIIDELLQDTDN